MGRNNSGRGALPKRVELDMSAIMNMEQKNSLQNLVTSIMEDMQRDLRDSFDNMGVGYDPSEEGIKPPKALCNMVPNPRSVKYRHLFSNKDNGDLDAHVPQLVPPAPILPPSLTSLTIPKSVDEASQMSGKSENEILSSSLSELKRDALAYFTKWRTNVQRRTGDMVIKGSGAGGAPAGQGPQQTQGTARRSHRFPPARFVAKPNGEPSPTVGLSSAWNSMLCCLVSYVTSFYI